MKFSFSSGKKGFQWKSYSFLTPPQNEQKHTLKTLKSKISSDVKSILLADNDGVGMIVCKMKETALNHVSIYSNGNGGC